MRFVDLMKLEFPPEWKTRAQQAQQEVASLNKNRRAAAINNRRQIWTDLKPCLEKLAHKKCWYCESKQIRSDKDIDHFRPKNRVDEKDSKNHPGYWWLAFDWRNFRYSCTYCNRPRTDSTSGTTGGKGSRFPLHDETKRCRTPQDLLSDEQPVLLDPTEEADPGFLWFDKDGTARPTSKDPASWLYQRAKKSIEIYRLNHTDLKEVRQSVCSDCTQIVRNGDDVLREYERGSLVAQTKFRETLKDLKKRLASNAEYSAAARATVMGLRGENHPWLDALLAGI